MAIEARCSELHSVIVGIDESTGEVCRIKVHVDGRMVQCTTTYLPSEQSPLIAAQLVFGLSNPRQFLVAEIDEAAAYAELLMQPIADVA